MLNIHMVMILATPHFWLVQPSQHFVSGEILGRHFLVYRSLTFWKQQTGVCFIFSCWHDTPWCPVVLHRGTSFGPSACMQGSEPTAAHSSGTSKWGRRSPASAPSSFSAHIQTKQGKKPPRSVQCQKPSFGGPAVTHHCGRSCLPGTAPLHLPAAAQQRNARVLGSLLRFNSEGAPSIHQGPYSPGPSNPDGFCSCASLVPTLALPCHPAHGIFPCPIP